MDVTNTNIVVAVSRAGCLRAIAGMMEMCQNKMVAEIEKISDKPTEAELAHAFTQTTKIFGSLRAAIEEISIEARVDQFKVVEKFYPELEPQNYKLKLSDEKSELVTVTVLLVDKEE